MNKQRIVLFDIDFTLFDTRVFKDSQLTKFALYDEVKSVLKKLSKIAELGIISKGESEFQKIKLKETGIADFFKEEDLHISVDKDINLMQAIDKYRNSKIFLVDDRLEVLHLAKKNRGHVYAIWVKRGWFAENQKEIPGFKADAEVENLSEVVKIVQSS